MLFRTVWLPLARLIGSILFFVLGPTRVIGRARIPRSGGLVILCNHISDVDPPAVQYACPRHVFFMAKSELFGIHLLGWILRGFGAFPVKRGEPDRESIRHAVELLRTGHAVGIFPEGELSEDSRLQEIKPGVALIVRMAQCPVICCGIRGTNRIVPYASLMPRPAWGGVSLLWGEPRTFDRSSSTEEILSWATDELSRLTS